jgi:ribosome-binding factor A
LLQIQLSPDLKQATVWWVVADNALFIPEPGGFIDLSNVPAPPEDAGGLLEIILSKEAVNLRRLIGKRLTIRHTPALKFRNDQESIGRAGHVESLLDEQLEQRTKSNEE